MGIQRREALAPQGEKSPKDKVEGQKLVPTRATEPPAMIGKRNQSRGEAKVALSGAQEKSKVGGWGAELLGRARGGSIPP